MAKSSKKLVFSPFTRVEGDLRLEVVIEEERVKSARASGTLFRGFEELVKGRDPMDAIVFLCRICGQCGAAHSAAAAAALAMAYGARTAPNGLIARNVMQAVELILSHVANFYFSFASDLCAVKSGEKLSGRFGAIRGSSFRKALEGRRRLLGVMGLFAGKWPNTLAIQPGGVTRSLSRSELTRAKGILAEFVRFIEDQMLGCRLGTWLENRSLEGVMAWMGRGDHAAGDLGCFVEAALGAGLERVGRGPGRFLSSGGFDLPGGTWLDSGFYDGGIRALDPSAITEDVTFSWYEAEPAVASPLESAATAAPEKDVAYSWAKAPRYAGKSVEVGPMARMLIGGDPLAADLVNGPGPSVFARVLLRLHEMVRVADELPRWIDRIAPEEPFLIRHEPKEACEGFALTEAPRGMLGHWVRIEHSRIRNYQVVTPTGWNLSPRDSTGKPGPLEEALTGTPAADAGKPAKVVTVVGSYDPCLYCSVH